MCLKGARDMIIGRAFQRRRMGRGKMQDRQCRSGREAVPCIMQAVAEMVFCLKMHVKFKGSLTERFGKKA